MVLCWWWQYADNMLVIYNIYAFTIILCQCWSCFCVMAPFRNGSVLESKYEDGEWKSRTNCKLEELSKGENIVKWIKGQRIRRLGHLERMEEDRMPKTMFTQELEGMRRRGRPRKWWREEVERDLPVLGVRRWRELVIDREKWRGIVRQAKAHCGL